MASSNRKKIFMNIQYGKCISLLLILYDIIVINLSYFLGLFLHYNLNILNIPKDYLHTFTLFAPIYTVFTVVVFAFHRLYKGIWRFAGYSELNHIAAASVITTLFHFAGITLIKPMPLFYYIFGAMMQFLLIIGIRFSYRTIILERNRRVHSAKATKNAMIIGAGDAGQVIIKELRNSLVSHAFPYCVIDDDKSKWGHFIEGVLVVGGRSRIIEYAHKYRIDQIMFAIPTATHEQKRDILNICKETGCELQTLPGVYQLVNGQVSLSKMKAVAVEDLLGRDQIKVNMDEIFQYLKGKRILVTGGGGSIGSELCRQIAEHEPNLLIIFDIYENNAYEIEQELKRHHPDLNLKVLIGSVRDSRRINWLFETYKPQIVYHAAAHKHVPLMENSPNEAIKNNVIGTYKTAYAAIKNGTERFVLISTDKAVNPTNIMGASKRLCEMVIQSMDMISRKGQTDILPSLDSHIETQKKEAFSKDIKQHESAPDEKQRNGNKARTQFAAVRFGNVLGSNGSVIPLFKKQIAEGGPVTVTHPDIIRYFMTIPEAVSLVLQAGVYAGGGEIFVLDMGEPVKIDTLARNLIKLSGYEPDQDISIIYTGLRPGEKLYEEKLMAEEGMNKTDNELIHIGKPIPFDVNEFLSQLQDLAALNYNNSDCMIEKVAEIVKTFHPSGSHPDGNEK